MTGGGGMRSMWHVSGNCICTGYFIEYSLIWRINHTGVGCCRERQRYKGKTAVSSKYKRKGLNSVGCCEDKDRGLNPRHSGGITLRHKESLEQNCISREGDRRVKKPLNVSSTYFECLNSIRLRHTDLARKLLCLHGKQQ